MRKAVPTGDISNADVATVRGALEARLREIAGRRRELEGLIRIDEKRLGDYYRTRAQSLLPDVERGTLKKLRNQVPEFGARSDVQDLVAEAKVNAPFWVWMTGGGVAWRRANTRALPMSMLRVKLTSYLGLLPIKPDWLHLASLIEADIKKYRTELQALGRAEVDLKKQVAGLEKLSRMRQARPNYLLDPQIATALRQSSARVQAQRQAPVRSSDSTGLSLLDVWLMSQLLQAGHSNHPTQAQEVFYGRGGEAGGAGVTAGFDDAEPVPHVVVGDPSPMATALGAAALGDPVPVPTSSDTGGDGADVTTADHTTLGSKDFS
ncbi:MAG: hypothetical protein AAB421_02125 [Patescibacteria group bacterium]